MKKILCFGDICPDLLIPYGTVKDPCAPSQGQLVQFRHGGSVANTASGLGRLQVPVLFAGTAGEDYFGRQLKLGLEEDGVDTRCMALVPGLMTVQILIVVDANRERTPFAFPPSGASQHQILPEQIPLSLLEEVGWMHASGITLREEPAAGTQLQLMEACKKRGIPVSLDINARPESRSDSTFSRYLQKALPLVDVLLGSLEEELCPLAEEDNPDKAVKKLLRQVPMVVARRGGNSALLYTQSQRYEAPVDPVVVEDSVGAGDAYNAGFLSALYEGLSPEAANRRGVYCGSVCVTRPGARSCPRREELPEGI